MRRGALVPEDEPRVCVRRGGAGRGVAFSQQGPTHRVRSVVDRAPRDEPSGTNCPAPPRPRQARPDAKPASTSARDLLKAVRRMPFVASNAHTNVTSQARTKVHFV